MPDPCFVITDALQSIMQGDKYWESYLKQVFSQKPPSVSLHLAVFVEPYLQYILDGSKTVESRFSVHRCAPYKSVRRGDVILLKRTGGPILGLCQVEQTWFYNLDPKSWRTIKNEFAQYLCANDPKFWEQRESASFATLIRLQHVRPVSPLKFTKRDRRGWVILQPGSEQLGLE